MYSQTQAQRIKTAKWKTFVSVTITKRMKEWRKRRRKRGKWKIIFFSVFSSACPLQTVPCVLHLGGQNERKHLKCCLVVLIQTGIEDQLHMYLCFDTCFFAGWCAIICRSFGISQLHPLDVLLADLLVLHDRTWVVFAYDTSSGFLDALWCLPGLIDVFSRKLL